MKLKCLLIFSVLVSTEAASLARRIIPVNVVYLEHGIFDVPRQRSHVRYLQNRNLDEKIQLSEEELKEANEHVPIAYKNAAPGEQNAHFLEKTKDAFLGGLSNLRKRIDGSSSVKNENKPSSEQWLQLNENIEEVFRKYKKSAVKEENQNTNFFTEMIQSANNWFQGVTNNRPNGEEDEQTEGSGIGQIWNDFQQSITTFFNNVSNNNQASSTINTVLGDTEVTSSTQSPDVFGFFNNIFNFNNQGGQSVQQGDPAGSSSTTQNILQGAYNNFINNFNPSSQKPAEPEGDTVTSSTQGPFGNFGEAVGQFFGQSTKPPNAAADSGSGNKPQPSFFDNVGNAFQSIFSPSSTTSSGVLSEGSTSGPNIPLVSTFQEGLQQVGSGLQFPGTQQNGGSSSGGNVPPIQQIQNIGQQIAENVPGNLGVGQLQEAGQQLGGNLQVPSNLNIDQIQSAGQQLGGNLQVPSNLNIDQIQGAGQQLGGNSQVPSNLNIDQIQGAGQQFVGNLQVPSNLNVDQIQSAGQQLAGNLQVPNNLNIDQIQSSGQQLAGNLQVPSNLNIDQIQTSGQQIAGNQQGPSNLGVDQLQNAGQQLLGGPSQAGSSSNVVNQIQSSSNQFQNAIGSVNNFPTNLNNVGSQIQQVVGSNQIGQLQQQLGGVPESSDSQSSSSRPPVSLINPINNFGEQLQLQLNPSTQGPDKTETKNKIFGEKKIPEEKVLSNIIGDKAANNVQESLVAFE